jgi:hypothetical protein
MLSIKIDFKIYILSLAFNSLNMSKCSICLYSTKYPFVSQCDHSFCNKCILQWVMCHDECPLCRAPISAPSRNTTVYHEEEPNTYKFWLKESASPQETSIIHRRVNDFIESFESVDSESKYNWKDNIKGSYLVVRNGDYFMDLFFKIYKHKYIRNGYIIIGEVTKRIMKTQYHTKQKKIKYNRQQHFKNHKRSIHFCK